MSELAQNMYNKNFINAIRLNLEKGKMNTRCEGLSYSIKK